MSYIINHKYFRILGILFVLSFYLQRPSIYIGFHLKMYMMMSGIIFIFFMAKIRKIPISSYDVIFIVFILYSGVTVLFSLDIVSGFRMLLGSIMVFFCYLSLKTYFMNINFNIEEIESCFYDASKIFILISLLMYMIGYFIISGAYSDYEHVRVYGVLVERGMPRLIGPLLDPNILSMYTSVLFYYLLFKNNKNHIDNIYLILTIVTIFLSLSRGGILAIIIPLSLYIIYRFLIFLYLMRIRHKFYFKLMLIVVIVFIVSYYLISTGEFSAFLEKRVSSVSNASGRFEIWSNLIQLWIDNPLFGIGWYNFLYYNAEVFEGTNYAHNTFLEVLVETGLVGFFIYIAFHFVIFINLIRLVYIDNRFKYFIFSYASIMVNFNNLSLVINEFLFLFLTLVSLSIYKLKR